MHPSKGIGYFCSLFGKSRQAWYELQNRKSKNDLQETLVLKLVEEIRQEMPRIGTQKLYYILKEGFSKHDIKIGRDKFYDLLSRHGYLLRYRRRKAITTNSNHPYKKYPNLIRDMLLTKPGQLWVSDITYIRTGNGFSYLSLITDAYSRKIVGYCLWYNLSSEGAINAVKMALNNHKKRKGLIHHSDRGIQYCCHSYVNILNDEKISISMTENGDPYENAIAERINGILKREFGLNVHFKNYEQAKYAVIKAVEVYNNKRPHSSCDYLTPSMAHKQNGILRQRWKNTSKAKTGVPEKVSHKAGIAVLL